MSIIQTKGEKRVFLGLQSTVEEKENDDYGRELIKVLTESSLKNIYTKNGLRFVNILKMDGVIIYVLVHRKNFLIFAHYKPLSPHKQQLKTAKFQTNMNDCCYCEGFACGWVFRSHGNYALYVFLNSSGYKNCFE